MIEKNSINSNDRSKMQEDRKIEKVITGKAIVRKKNVFNKLADEFISDDAKNVKSYVLGDVLIPAIKKAISDIVTNGIDMILYGETRNHNKPYANKISYRNYWDRDNQSSYRDDRLRYNNFSYDDIILNSRADAEDVLNNMNDIIRNYGFVRVADLFELVGYEDNNFMNNKYGWMNISNAEVVRVRDGYLIKMPKPSQLD